MQIAFGTSGLQTTTTHKQYNMNIFLLIFQGDELSHARPSVRSRGTDEPHIGKYRLIKTIGKGNFAKVKLAKHVPTNREVSAID